MALRNYRAAAVSRAAAASHSDVAQAAQGALDMLRARAEAHEQKSIVVLRDPDMPLIDYTAEAWRVVEPATPFERNWHHEAICDHAEAAVRLEIKRLIINIPPRHTKSLIVSVMLPTWVWTWMPHWRWLFNSYAQSLSTRDAVKGRNLIQSPWYQRRWGDVFQLAGDQNTKLRYDNDRTGYRISTSVEGGSTGEGGDGVVVDDPHNIKEIESDADREEVLRWWDEVMPTRGNHPVNHCKIIIMQRSHDRDLTGHVLAKEAGYEHLMLPGEYDPRRSKVTSLGFKDPRKEKGELLWPSRFTREVMVGLKRELGPNPFSAQINQDPVPGGGSVFKEVWFKYWRMKPPAPGQAFTPGYVLLPPVFTQHKQSWDFTFKGDTDHDFVAGLMGSVLNADLFIRGEYHDQLDFPETIKALMDFTARFPEATKKLIEDKANGPAVIASLRKKVAGLVPVDNKGSNLHQRASAVSAYVHSGNVYLPDPTMPGYEWVRDWLAEVTRFPKAAYDDRTAAFVQLLMDVFGVTSTADALERLLRAQREAAEAPGGTSAIAKQTPNTLDVTRKKY